MNRLNREQVIELSRLCLKLEDTRQSAEEAVAEYTDTARDAEAFREDVVLEMQEFWDSQPESWQVCGEGQAFRAWLNTWEDAWLLDESFDANGVDDFTCLSAAAFDPSRSE